MSYQSFEFILFTMGALLLYYIVGRKRQMWVLALANLSFYLIAGRKYLPFILITMAATYGAGRWIGSIYEKLDSRLAQCTEPAQKKEARNTAKKQAKRALLAGLFVAVGLLAVCKYTTFTLTNLNLLLDALHVPQVEMFRMVLPLGISFYTFMAVSYVLDIYWKRYKAEKNFLTYAVYLSYFPHVAQGPIDRFNEFRDQIREGVAFSYENLTFGAQLTIWGFFKKLVVADRLGIFVGGILDNWQAQDGILILLALAVYSIQIYADFSGCIDIVTGVSEMFGIKLRKNFNHPYFSRTMAEFWRRWHISLQEWFKDYVYYPVSASQFTKKMKKKLKAKGHKRAEELFSSCFPILVVWMVTGIWHGAAWKFVAWGLFHAALLIGSKILEPYYPRMSAWFHLDEDNFGWHVIQMLRTYFLCCVGRIFFRAGSFLTGLGMVGHMLHNTSLKALFVTDFSSFGLSRPNLHAALLSCLVLLVVDAVQEKIHIRETLAKQNIIFRWILIYGALFAVIIFGIYGPGYNASEFIYGNF